MGKSKRKLTDEELAIQRAANLEKARLASMAKAKAEKDARIWPSVNRRITATKCKCHLVPGMNKYDLLPLGAGCTALPDGPGWVCPALDLYRRLIENPSEASDVAL